MKKVTKKEEVSDRCETCQGKGRVLPTDIIACPTCEGTGLAK